MWTFALLWLALAGAAASLRCPDGRPCAAAPSLPMFSANSVSEPAGSACQDGSRCPAGYSCLPAASGSFACCPLAEGVPCAGGHRCCPRGSQCSADGKSCFTRPALSAIQCPDGESECPDNSTCCAMPSGAWGCCPMPEASCCADKVHCCPRATVCDLARGRCLAPAGPLPLRAKLPARRSQPWVPALLSRVTCPDGLSACPDGTTCCQLPSAQYGCCPLQNAVCCSDRRHCCPQGTACDLERSECASARGAARPLARLPAAPAAVGDVKCDEEMSCPDGNTCCRLSSGKWGCCPLEQAVCCPDHVHCCPQGYTCDPEGGSCLLGGVRMPWQEKVPALARGRDVKCDEETSCPDGNTCCRLSSGKWGCCPLEQAVCCPDHVHCCPQGYTCDPEGGSCLLGGVRVPWQEKTPALARGRDVKCDEEMSCPDGNTCCRLSSGKWGCCPLEQGSGCPPEGGSCLQPGVRLAQPAVATAAGAGWVLCDTRTACPDNTTCCRAPTGPWLCCPLPQAVCCSDGFHCCPSGYTCDLAQGTCHQEQLAVPWVAKTPAARRGRAVKCNATASCADGQTCCRSQSGDWACCQLPSAVCCKDRQHCCPRGYTCNVAAQSCEKRRAPGPRVQSARSQPAAAGPCAGARSSCAGGRKCCPGPGGSWSCCPFLQGSCCSDGRRCCPAGYLCTSGSCSRRRPLRWDLAGPDPGRVLL
ncbi:progranulin [Rhea pennata]|uniref:progranulin n=1 Tax=Rhea pennata TaxID=8795 RepID=UPI002E26FC6E